MSASNLKLVRSSRMFWSSAVMSCALAGLNGCNPPNSDSKSDSMVKEDHDHDGHDHDAHDHDAGHSHGKHEHGAHGGELVTVEPGDYKIEWTHDEAEGTVTMFVDEVVETGKAVEKLQVKLEMTGQDAKFYDLDKQADGTFMAKDIEMVTAIDASGEKDSGIKASVVALIDGIEQMAELEIFHH